MLLVVRPLLPADEDEELGLEELVVDVPELVDGLVVAALLDDDELLSLGVSEGRTLTAGLSEEVLLGVLPVEELELEPELFLSCVVRPVSLPLELDEDELPLLPGRVLVDELVVVDGRVLD